MHSKSNHLSVVEGVRRVMGGIALWETLVGTGFGVLLGLPAGAYLNRQSVKYEQRASCN